MPQYRVIRADLDRDRRTILDIWKRNLSSTEELERKFDWHFLRNPYGEARCWLLLADEEPVGSSALGMRPVQTGQEVITAGVACDLAVDREHRTLQPALLLQKAVVSATGDGVQLVYGLPNPRGAAPIRRVGYRDAGAVERHAKVLRLIPFLERDRRWRRLRFAGVAINSAWSAWARLWERVAPQYRAAVVHGFDERFDALWQQHAASYPVIGVRDRRFLNWRFAQCPLQRYSTLALFSRDESRLYGYMTWYMEGTRMMCADLFAPGDDRRLESLLAAVASHGRRAGAASVSIAASLPLPITSAFERSGFRLRSAVPAAGRQFAGTPDAITEVARTLLVYASANSPALANPWYFTPGDEPYN